MSDAPESIISITLVCRMNWQFCSRTAGSVSEFDSSRTVSMRAALPLVTSLPLLARSNALISWSRCQVVSMRLCEPFWRVETQSRMGSGRFWAWAKDVNINRIGDSKADSRRIEAHPLVGGTEHQTRYTCNRQPGEFRLSNRESGRGLSRNISIHSLPLGGAHRGVYNSGHEDYQVLHCLYPVVRIFIQCSVAGSDRGRRSARSHAGH